MNALSENSLIAVSPETIQTFHDLALMWINANIDAGELSPEQLFFEYKKTYDKIVAADTEAQKAPSTSPW